MISVIGRMMKRPIVPSAVVASDSVIRSIKDGRGGEGCGLIELFDIKLFSVSSASACRCLHSRSAELLRGDGKEVDRHSSLFLPMAWPRDVTFWHSTEEHD